MSASHRAALVLVASSRDAARVQLVDTIERAGYRAVEALDGVHAIAVATRHLPDVVVADVVLAKLDGVELGARLSTEPETSGVRTILVRDDDSDADAGETRLPVVCSIDDLLWELERATRGRTSKFEYQQTLRRAMADIRAAAREHADDELAAPAYARELANGVTEQMISVLVADDEARYVEANAAICALTGYSRVELLDMTIWDLTAEPHVARGQKLWKRFLRDGRYEGPYRIRRRTGEAITIHCASAANVAPGLHVSTMAPTRLLAAIRS